MVLFLVSGPSGPCADRAFLAAEAHLVNLYREVVAHPYHLAYHCQDQILDHGLKVLGVLSVDHLCLQVCQVLMNIFPNIHNRQLREFHFDKNLPFIQYPEVTSIFQQFRGYCIQQFRGYCIVLVCRQDSEACPFPGFTLFFQVFNVYCLFQDFPCRVATL